MEEDDPMDYGDFEDQSDVSILDSEDGFAEPEAILCESDQDFPHRGHLFLVKWKNCSILRSSWEWEKMENPYSDSPEMLHYLEKPHPIRMVWEEKKERQARGEERRFDVAQWQANVCEEEDLRKRRRVLRRWKRRLEGIRRVLQAQQEDAEEDIPDDMIRRLDIEDRDDTENKEKEAQKKRKREEEAEAEKAEQGGDETEAQK